MSSQLSKNGIESLTSEKETALQTAFCSAIGVEVSAFCQKKEKESSAISRIFSLDTVQDPGTCSYVFGQYEETHKDEKYKSTMKKALADSKLTLNEFGAYMQPRLTMWYSGEQSYLTQVEQQNSDIPADHMRLAKSLGLTEATWGSLVLAMKHGASTLSIPHPEHVYEECKSVGLYKEGPDRSFMIENAASCQESMTPENFHKSLSDALEEVKIRKNLESGGLRSRISGAVGTAAGRLRSKQW